MLKPKVYVLVCHGCGSFHTQTAEFLASPCGVEFKVEGNRSWMIPTLGCPECMATPRDEANPEAHPIVRAFRRGMTSTAFDRANLAFRAHWRGVLEARKAAR